MHLLAIHEHGSFILGPKLLYMQSTIISVFCFSFFSTLKKQLQKDKNNIIYKNVLPFNLPNTRAIKRIGPHNEDIISILVGALLGDAGAERNMNGGYDFDLNNQAFIKIIFYYLYNFLNLRGYCNNNLPVLKIHKGFTYLTFDTYSFTSLLWLYKAFYNTNKVKKIPSNIEELLTPLALSI